ncbi:MAG: M23 family metallopeptidase [Rhizobiaceae bacterium]|nr:M23 family metallopeptidase [Rhizobiaceae bacterium]
MRFAVLVAGLMFSPAVAKAVELGLPAQCTPGKDCFLQQFPDMDPGDGVSDPYCGTASYQGHKGTDLRILSMQDVERGVPVVAVADGTVLRGRDGVADHLISTDADRAAVKSKECGNGIILDVGSGVEVQYCHMRQGSLAVKPGQQVKRGEKLGEIGASGLAQFPHVHITVRVDGKEVDPSTGRVLTEGCLQNPSDARPLFSAEVLKEIGQGEPQVIEAGLTGAVFDHDSLTLSGPPPEPTKASENIVGWGWFINLRKDDRIRITLTGPDGQKIAERTSDALDRSKASFSGYAGKRGAPKPGAYSVVVAVIRDGDIIAERSATATVE